MKVRNLIKLLPALMLGIIITGNALAVELKDYHKTIKADKVFTIRPANFVKGPNITLNEEAIRDLEQLIGRIDEVRMVFENEGAPEILISLKPNDEAGLESWMLEQDYLSEEKTQDIEAWMSDTNYIATEATHIESWMLEDDYLESESARVESWMMEADYLENETSGMESWMTDPGYLGLCGKIN